MILEFFGFFVVFGAGAVVLWFACSETYFYLKHRLFLPLNWDDAIEAGVYLVGFCIALGLLYYAATHAPFTVAIDFNLKVQ